MAHYSFMIAEWISFFIDVKFLGVSGKERFHYFFKPCKRCGWSNVDATHFMEQIEKEKLKCLHFEKRSLSSASTKLKYSSDEDD